MEEKGFQPETLILQQITFKSLIIKNYMIPNLKKELEFLLPQVRESSWSGYEFVKGYGIFGLPLSSGHTLALRVFPVNNFAPYVTIWHQTPDGKWTIYYDAVRADVACPRYYGNAAHQISAAKINLKWLSSSELLIQMEEPKLEWTIKMYEPFHLHLINAVSKRMPLWTWKPSALLKFREWMAFLLGAGKIKLKGYMPSGHLGILMPQRMYFIRETEIRLNGADLGHELPVYPNPKIGDVPLPARGIFAIGEAYWEIINFGEYYQTKKQISVQNDVMVDC